MKVTTGRKNTPLYIQDQYEYLLLIPVSTIQFYIYQDRHRREMPKANIACFLFVSPGFSICSNHPETFRFPQSLQSNLRRVPRIKPLPLPDLQFWGYSSPITLSLDDK